MQRMSFATLAARLQSFRLEQSIQAAITDNADEVADHVREQLLHGFAGDGKRLKPYKSPAYARAKHRLNALAGYGNPDGKKSGRLHSEITTEAKQTGFSIGSKTPYAKYLEKRDGSRIYGLTKDSKANVNLTIIRPRIVTDLSRHTGLRIIR